MTTFKKLLNNKPLLILGFAESVSGIGNWITMMAVFSLLVFEEGGSVAAGSGVFLAGLVPTLLMSPLAGWLLDRYNRKYLMIGCQVLAGAAITGLIFTNHLLLIYTLLALESVFLTVMGPARQSVIPDLVEQADLTKANALLHQLASFIKIGAPMFAGFVLTMMSPHTAILLDVLSFLLAGLILTRLPSLPAHGTAQTNEVDSISTSGFDGADRLTTDAYVPVQQDSAASSWKNRHTSGLWQYIKGSSKLSLLLILIFLGIFIIIGFDVLAPVFIRDILKSGEDTFGLLIGLVGAGTLISSTFLFFRKDAQNLWRDFILGLFLLAVIPLFLAGATVIGDPVWSKLLAITGAFVGGIGNGLLTVQSGTLLQVLSPKPLLGRISGLFQSVAVSGQLVGLLLTPVLVPVFLSIGAYFLISALLLMGLSIFGLWVNRRSSKPATQSSPGSPSS